MISARSDWVSAPMVKAHKKLPAFANRQSVVCLD
jgi:hypothetical protein